MYSDFTRTFPGFCPGSPLGFLLGLYSNSTRLLGGLYWDLHWDFTRTSLRLYVVLLGIVPGLYTDSTSDDSKGTPWNYEEFSRTIKQYYELLGFD